MSTTTTIKGIAQAEADLEAAELALQALRQRTAAGDRAVTPAALKDAQGDVEMAQLRLDGARRWEEDTPRREAEALAERARALVKRVADRQDERIRLRHKAAAAIDDFNRAITEDNALLAEAANLLHPQILAHLPEGYVSLGPAHIHVGEVGMCRHGLIQPPHLFGRYDPNPPAPTPEPVAEPVLCKSPDGHTYTSHRYTDITDPFETGAYKGGKYCYACGKKLTRAEWAQFRPAHEV